MASGADFLKYWALSFVTLSAALILLSIFYRLLDSDLGLDEFRKEAVLAVIASAVQGAGFWFSASLFPGDPFRTMLLPGLIVSFTYRLAHLAAITLAVFIGGLAIIGSIAKNL